MLVSAKPRGKRVDKYLPVTWRSRIYPTLTQLEDFGGLTTLKKPHLTGNPAVHDC